MLRTKYINLMDKIFTQTEKGLFKNEKGNWVNGFFHSYIPNTESSCLFTVDGCIQIAHEFKKIEEKDDRSTYHIAYYTDKSNIYSNGLDIKANTMLDALLDFNHKFKGIEPIYIIKK